MKLFARINKKYDYGYLTDFWLHRSLILEKALSILHETVIIGDTFTMIGNIKKYITHIKNYNMLCDGFRKTRSIIEWGGGLGIMANIIMKKYKQIQTYIIIDIPIMSYLQARYFYFKKIPVHVVTENCKNIRPGINIVSLSFINDIDFYPDMFISTWAISESSRKSLKYASDHRLFKCKHLLIAHNRHELEEFPHSPLYGIRNCMKVEIDADNEYVLR